MGEAVSTSPLIDRGKTRGLWDIDCNAYGGRLVGQIWGLAMRQRRGAGATFLIGAGIVLSRVSPSADIAKLRLRATYSIHRFLAHCCPRRLP